MKIETIVKPTYYQVNGQRFENLTDAEIYVQFMNYIGTLNDNDFKSVKESLRIDLNGCAYTRKEEQEIVYTVLLVEKNIYTFNLTRILRGDYAE